MPGTKRTYSVAFPEETPPKILKRKSTSKASAAGILEPVSGAPRPSLQKASTLTLADIGETDDSVTSPGTKGPKRTSTLSKGRPVSLVKKSSVERGSLVSRLSGLKSGSIVGETTVAEEPTLSKKASSVRVPSLPSGLTKLAMSKTGSKGSLRVSKSQLLDGVDETEMVSALESLKPKLSKTGSKASIASAKSASIRSAGSLVRVPSGAKDKTADAEDDTADEPSAGSASPVLPPGGLVEVAISFDTTGSMYGVLEEVRAKIKDLAQRLQADIPGIRIAVIAHGDYCDYATYIVKWIDFGASLPELCDFVETVERTSGGDGPECYELVLKRAREVLSWTPGSQRVLIMINDDIPHEPGYNYGGKKYYINWRDECVDLANMGVKIYGVRSGGDNASKKFNEQMARFTGGKHVELEDFNSIFDFIMMICYREANPDMIEVYEAEMRARAGRGIAKDAERVAKIFKDSSGDTDTTLPFKYGGKAPKKTAAAKRAPAKATKAAAAKAPKKAAVKAKVKKTGVKGTKTTKVKGARAVKKGKKKAGKKVDIVLKREKVPESKLSTGKLNTLTWTKWLLAISPVGVKPATKTKKSDFDHCCHHSGHRIQYIFGNKTRVPAVYEFAVSPPGTKAGKKYVVYFRKSTGYASKISWHAYLLRNKKVWEEVEMCVEAGCSLWVRKGVPKGRSDADKIRKVVAAGRLMKTSFDYAWKKYIWRKTDGKMYHRQLTIPRKGSSALTISHGDL